MMTVDFIAALSALNSVPRVFFPACAPRRLFGPAIARGALTLSAEAISVPGKLLRRGRSIAYRNISDVSFSKSRQRGAVRIICLSRNARTRVTFSSRQLTSVREFAEAAALLNAKWIEESIQEVDPKWMPYPEGIDAKLRAWRAAGRYGIEPITIDGFEWVFTSLLDRIIAQGSHPEIVNGAVMFSEHDIRVLPEDALFTWAASEGIKVSGGLGRGFMLKDGVLWA